MLLHWGSRTQGQRQRPVQAAHGIGRQAAQVARQPGFLQRSQLLGQDHRYSVPVSALCGSLLLLLADTLSRSMGSGSALPVGAITSLLGAPFFVAVIFSKKEDGVC